VKKNSSMLLLVIFIFGLSMHLFFQKKDIVIDETVSQIINDRVFNYIDSNKYFLNSPNDFNNYYLLFDEIKLNTNNFIQIFNIFKEDELMIRKIYPYINPEHENRLKKHIGEINFSNNEDDNINKIVTKYINALNQYGLDEEINKVNIHGVSIRIVAVNVKNKAMYNFLVNNKKVKFSTSLYGNYYKIR